MARIRSIKPEFWKNETLGTMPPLSQLLFIALWNLADRRGFIEFRPAKIKAEVFPYRRISLEQLLKPLLSEFCRLIDVNGVTYIQIVKFCKHQVFNVREPESTVPEQYWNSTDTVPVPWEGKGREGKGRDARTREGKSSPINFEESKEMIMNFPEWKKSIMENFNLDEINFEKSLNEFFIDTNNAGRYPRTIEDTKSHFYNSLKKGKYLKKSNSTILEEDFFNDPKRKTYGC